MHTIRIRLFAVVTILILTGMACIASSQGQSSESEEALAKFQACSDDFADRGFAGIQYLDCLQPLSINELEAIREHDFCLANPDCLVAVQSALDTNRAQATQTEEGPCAGLTPEECANAGSHAYTGTVTANLDICGISSINPLEQWTFSFGEGGVDFNKFSRSSIAGYSTHMRIAENTYEFTYPDGLTTNRITFSQNGFIEEAIFDAGCELTHTYTFSE
ncbi:MAG: hypothetical protein DWQ07_21745 [Chloroflexi bacterium]|nr:MAG: hypothetical protein DWQ07_21745 [Chloroflexota bacterium]MBL1197325.1 hypothetical protein [Chloroflexota bacterium]NOH14621.1 hypothetical protein [Chloroflexota bacterium]